MITEAHKHKTFSVLEKWKTAAVSEKTCTDGVEIKFFYFSFSLFLTGKFPYRNVVISFHIDIFFSVFKYINSRAACESWADSTTLINNTYLLETLDCCSLLYKETGALAVNFKYFFSVYIRERVEETVILWYMCWSFCR